MKTPNFIDRHVGSRLRLLRLSRGLDSLALAREAGISETRLAAFEEGRERLPAALMRKLSRILDAPPSEFFVGLSHGGPGARNEAEVDGSEAEQEQRLLADFARIRDAKCRGIVLALVAAYAEFGDLERR